jgi:hypothetical protein
MFAKAIGVGILAYIGLGWEEYLLKMPAELSNHIISNTTAMAAFQ